MGVANVAFHGTDDHNVEKDPDASEDYRQPRIIWGKGTRKRMRK